MKEEGLDIKLIIQKALKYWYLFILLLPLSLAGAYLYLRYTPPMYDASLLLLIKDEESSGQLNEEAAFAEIGFGNQKRNLKNELLILKSTPLMLRVVEALDLQNNYINLASTTKENLYKKSPVRILDWQPEQEGGELYAELYADKMGGFRLTTEIGENQIERRGEFGRELILPNGRLILSRTESNGVEFPVGIAIISKKAMARMLANSLIVEEADKESSILLLSIRDVSAERARDILTELAAVYNESTIEEENQVYGNTIDLINERVQLIAGELSEAEQEVEAYKRRFNMVELSAEGSLLMKEVATYNKEISSTEVQLEILNSIEDFLARNQNKFEFVPTNMAINNLTLANQLSSFNELLAERERLKSDLGASHPDLLLAQKQIQNLRQTIIDNIRSIKTDLVITRNASQAQRDNMESRLHSLPRRERELIEIERRKNIKENLYLYLLQKREESAISLAVTVAKGKVVEPAEAPSLPASPNQMQIWVIAAFLGLTLPAGIIVLTETLNDKLQYEDDLTKLASVPVIGAIGRKREKGPIAVKENSRTPVAEMFRLLRTNLAYAAPGKQLQCLLVTSSGSGEGKSFIALNLGMTLAFTGKRVLILELDLRRPKQEIYSRMENTGKGVVNFLIDNTLPSSQIIRNSGLHPNLDLISSGPTPPNPSELILSPRLRELAFELKEKYDYILMDAPPVGLVADALQLKDLAEATMYVVRIGLTRKGQLQIIEDIAQKGKLPNPFIVVNAVPMNKKYYYGYGYGYNYSYGYGYAHDSKGYYTREKKGLLRKLKTAMLS